MVQSPKDQNLLGLLKDVFRAFLMGDFSQAEQKASEAHGLDFENQEVKDALLCSMFWKERWNRLREIHEQSAQADYLFTEYQGFKNRFLGRLNSPMEEGLYSIRQYVLGRCIELYKAISEKDSNNLEYQLNIAKCYKSLGDYDQAIETLEKTNRLFRDEAEVLAEMADCYEIISESRLARVLFREAFFVNPQKIDLTFLESPLIKKILETLSDKAYSSLLLKEWLPVYGVLLGIFNIKRELKPMELAQLKQSIHSLRNELQAAKRDNNPLLPRLINKYFWLIDHYQSVKEDRIKIEEVLLNIKLLDQNIYNLYTN